MARLLRSTRMDHPAPEPTDPPNPVQKWGMSPKSFSAWIATTGPDVDCEGSDKKQNLMVEKIGFPPFLPYSCTLDPWPKWEELKEAGADDKISVSNKGPGSCKQDLVISLGCEILDVSEHIHAMTGWFQKSHLDQEL